jgi:signal transduction histidine kinase
MMLDYPTILFFLAINNLFIISLFTYQYFYHHKKWYLSVVTIGLLFQTISFILVGSRSILPFLYTVQISNLFLISSFAVTSFGLVSFDGKIRKNILWVFSIFTVLFYISFLTVEDNNTIRIIIQIIASSFFYGIGAYYLFKNKEKHKFSIFISSVLLLYSIFQIVRASVIYHIGDSYNFLKGSSIDNWYLIISLFAISASSIGLIMLLKEIDQKTIHLKNIKIHQNKLELEELNLTKDKLFSIIAHDLRSPFNGILGFSELLIENRKKFDDAKTEKYLKVINSLAKNTLNLLDNLLQWAKTQTGQIIYKPEKTNLTSTIKEVVEAFSSIAKNKNIILNHIHSDPIEVFTDVNMLKVVLRNLISNALKFTNPGGRIELSAIQNKNNIEITISDNGVGMDEDTLNKLFKINNTLTTTGTAAEKGSGLGLILCKEFVEKLRGEIWVESILGKGSSFKFTLGLN